MVRKLPIGIQDFEKIRTENYVYVDKTTLMYRLASDGHPCFLGRPRRFGKSLLVSALKEHIFLEKKSSLRDLALKSWNKNGRSIRFSILILTGRTIAALAALSRV
jgi:hypothetical protein